MSGKHIFPGHACTPPESYGHRCLEASKLEPEGSSERREGHGWWSKALAANSEEMAHLEVPRKQLETLLEQVKALTARQASLTASKQEVSKQLAYSARRLLRSPTEGCSVPAEVNRSSRNRIKPYWNVEN